ncbi:isochorismatase family protein [Cupriavidus agavae]|uniref:Nicotinamidase-related amidase n=1 Tax=Cupriavidus agavae TaxID=1001822 RepID=A0A4Q7RBQ2_9BURK|nr:isochorismatase family protein [Cupriavidus agavae]RZT29052.1 nicotinamidase-related amidase [Cupriavidus agavae]
MAFERLTGSNAALLLIDHQVGTIKMVSSMPGGELKQNAVMLAKTAHILGMPIVLTTSMEDHQQGPLIDELQEISRDAFDARVKRTGIVNAMEDPLFAQAVQTTRRQRFILAGVTNDVCTVFPALSLLDRGHEVFVVADAGGSPSAMGDNLALRRMERAGATVLGTGQVVAELAENWSSPQGQEILQKVIAPAMR